VEGGILEEGEGRCEGGEGELVIIWEWHDHVVRMVGMAMKS